MKILRLNSCLTGLIYKVLGCNIMLRTPSLGLNGTSPTRHDDYDPPLGLNGTSPKYMVTKNPLQAPIIHGESRFVNHGGGIYQCKTVIYLQQSHSDTG